MKLMPMRSTTCYYRASLGPLADGELMNKDLRMQHGRWNMHNLWGWEGLASNASSTTDYMTLNSKQFRIPSTAILMVFTPANH